MPRLEGQRILLREYRQEDYAAIAAWQNDSGVTRYLGTPFWLIRSEGDVQEYLQNRMQGSHNAYYFVIADRESGRYIGQLDLYAVDWRQRCAILGMVVTTPGRGIGQEALGLVRRFAFDTLGLERLELELAEDNLPALHCYLKAHFRQEGIKRHACYYDGAFRNVILMGLIREDCLEE